MLSNEGYIDYNILLLGSLNPVERRDAAYRLGTMGSRAQAAVCILLEHLADYNDVGDTVEWAIREIGIWDELSIEYGIKIILSKNYNEIARLLNCVIIIDFNMNSIIEHLLGLFLFDNDDLCISVAKLIMPVTLSPPYYGARREAMQAAAKTWRKSHKMNSGLIEIADIKSIYFNIVHNFIENIKNDENYIYNCIKHTNIIFRRVLAAAISWDNAQNVSYCEMMFSDNDIVVKSIIIAVQTNSINYNVQNLINFLYDNSAIVRRESAVSLARIGKPAIAACDHLSHTISDPDPSVRHRSAQACESIFCNEIKCINSLIYCISTEQNTIVFQSAVSALSTISLQNSLNLDSSIICDIILNTKKHIRANNNNILITELSLIFENSSIQFIDDCSLDITLMMNNSLPYIRQLSVMILDRLINPNSVIRKEYLQNMERDVSDEVQIAAANALDRLDL